MSRLTNTVYEEEIVEHDNGIGKLNIDINNKEDKVVIADFDSLLFIASYTGKDEEGNKKPEYTKDEYEIAEGILDEAVLKILMKVEEYFNIRNFYICLKGKNNFRYKLDENYKANRPPSLPIINHLRDFMIKKYDGVICSDGCESDDCCYSISETINHEGIILTIDKDFNQIPSIFYNYKKDVWFKVTEDEARWNFALQMCTGDSGDNIKGLVGIGPKKAEKIINRSMTNYQYIKNIFLAYQKCYKEEAKEKMKLMYNLLKLHNINNLPKIK